MEKQLENAINYFNQLILNELKEYSVKCFVAGGAMRSYFAGERLNDIDLFFHEEKDLIEAQNYFITHKKAKVVFENNNVIKLKYKGKIFDLVRKYYGTPNEIIDNFDFTVTCAAVTNNDVIVHPTFFMDLAKKALVVNKLPFPLSSLQRLQRYVKKGYTACNGTLLELAKALQTLDLENPDENTLVFYPDGRTKFVRFD